MSEMTEIAGELVRIYRGSGTGLAVVFVNGCGVTSEFWQPVTTRLRNPWLAFDRPGLSTPSSTPLHSLQTQVEILARLASEATRDGKPPIIVAHSMGALHTEALLRLHPGAAAGVVLVDPAIETKVRPKLPSTALAKVIARLPHSPFVACAGNVVFRAAALQFTTRGSIPDTDTPRNLRGILYECLTYQEHANELIELRSTTSLPTVPVRLLEAPPFSELETFPWPRNDFIVHRFPHAKHLLMVDVPNAVIVAIETLGI
ncbi:pimeloyl-ACP methyl ester carboxylesterase [Trueperella bonasi]|uniref:Pimeloyl-ACP methyl ester carboxylesterase n=1 Tax=Trueperella bonasi TaxID=312286 RepID=A0ABT9NJD1_9ACTO|nr:alpha/beta hydrolase [Trueperella bonasi]MDP9806913.1 pimeloyl-ACP methyl ester carboxylesterase [Trueperella bonasi]